MKTISKVGRTFKIKVNERKVLNGRNKNISTN